MTREEARDFLYKKMRSYSGKIEINKELVDLIEVDELINKIYNDFESRICKNCKWCRLTRKGSRLCENPKNENFCYYPLWVDENFGCNRFERKENENIK